MILMLWIYNNKQKNKYKNFNNKTRIYNIKFLYQINNNKNQDTRQIIIDMKVEILNIEKIYNKKYKN